MMKISMLALCVLVSSSVASISALAKEDTKADIIKRCTTLSEFAGMSMEARQLNIPLTELLPGIGDSELFQSIVFKAYERPLMPTDEYKEREKNEYANKWFIACVNTYTNLK